MSLIDMATGKGRAKSAGAQDTGEGRLWSLVRKDRGTPGLDFAVAVRDGAALRLHLHLRREPNGDIYLNWPRRRPGWKPHTSYHASGQHHQKSFGHASMVYQRPKPDATFTGLVNAVTTSISLEEVRSVDEPCVPEDFVDIFEIPGSVLLEVRQQTIAVDLVEPGGKELWKPGSYVLRQKIFTDAIPGILVTLWEDEFGLELLK